LLTHPRNLCQMDQLLSLLYSAVTQPCFQLWLAMGQNSWFRSRSGSDPERDHYNGFPPTTWHFKSTILAPIKYLSSDCIVTWSVCRLRTVRPSFPSRSHICDRTNICWVAIENPHISAEILRSLTAIQQISVQSQIWQREVKEGAETAQSAYLWCHNTIRTQILNWSQSCRNHNMEPWSGSNPSPNPVGNPDFWVITLTWPSRPVPNPDCSWVTRNHC
jgi:hypothetical protein